MLVFIFLHLSFHRILFLLSNATKSPRLCSPVCSHTPTHCVGLKNLGDMTQLDDSTCFCSRAICSSTSQTCSRKSECFSLSVCCCTLQFTINKQYKNYNNAWIIAPCIASRSSNSAFHALSVGLYLTQSWWTTGLTLKLTSWCLQKRPLHYWWRGKIALHAHPLPPLHQSKCWHSSRAFSRPHPFHHSAVKKKVQ